MKWRTHIPEAQGPTSRASALSLREEATRQDDPPELDPSHVGDGEEATAFAMVVTHQLLRARAELLAVRAERDAADRRFEAISTSTIWRLSAPLRRAVEWLSKVRAGSRPTDSLSSTALSSEDAASQPKDDLTALKTAYRDHCALKLETFLASGNQLPLPAASEPRVSIILVLFNQAELTLQCLSSLALAAGTDDEVIILDNNSTDRTGALLDRLTGAHVIRMPENLHFLCGVNRAAQDARGRYLLILNNDTRVEPGAITAAAARLDAEPDLGAVGGPIVMLDGTLQEAGCIIWSNGHVQGYGRGHEAHNWEFQFRRDVDYCSGAFLMVRRDLFEKLGGLDAAYAPAYFEETDLCMRIREAGFRVGYEPAAPIMHYGYGSATCPDAALHLYTRNRERFVVRHAMALARGHYEPGTSVLLARTRSGSAGPVLIVESRIGGAGAAALRAMGRWLARALLNAGFAVTYCAQSEAQGDFSDVGAGLPKDAERAIIADPDGVSELLRARTGHYKFVVLLYPEQAGLPTGTKTAVASELAGAVLIEVPC